MLKLTKIETSLLETNRLFLFVGGVIIFILTGLSGAIFLSTQLGFSLTIIVIGVVIFFICPLLFINQKMNVFSKKAIIELTNEYFKISIINKKTEGLEKEYVYRYSDIKSFQMAQSEFNDSSYLKLILKNREKAKFSFFKQLNDEHNVLKNIKSFFALYNENKNLDERITLLPNFYATKAGGYSVIGLGAFICIAIVLQLIYKPQTIPFSLLTGIFLYLRIKNLQKSDKELYENFK